MHACMQHACMYSGTFDGLSAGERDGPWSYTMLALGSVVPLGAGLLLSLQCLVALPR